MADTAPELIQEMLRWLPVAERAFGLSGFRIILEDGQPFIAHERADDRVLTTVKLLREIHDSGYLIVGVDNFRGTFEEVLALPRDAGGGIPAKFSPLGLLRMLAVQSNQPSNAPVALASSSDDARKDPSALVATLRSWVPAASRAGGVSPFPVVVELGQAYVCHQTASAIRIPTTVEALRAAEDAGLVVFTEGWRGNNRDGVDHLPSDLQFDGAFTALGIQLMLQLRADVGARKQDILALVDVLAAALDDARQLVAELNMAIDSGKSKDPDVDADNVVILRKIIIPELERLPDESPEDIRVAERIGFYQRLKTFVWDTRVIGLINLIVNIYSKMG